MSKARNALLVIALIGLTLTACSSSSNSSSSSTTTGVTVTTTAPGTTVNIVVSDTKGLDGPMTMTVSPASVPAGKVTFVAKNTGTIEHEVVVLKTDTAFDQIPVGTDDKVSEDTSIGEIAEFAAGTTDSVTLDVPAGNYVLVCNIAKHYAMGMRVAFKAT